MLSVIRLSVVAPILVFGPVNYFAVIYRNEVIIQAVCQCMAVTTQVSIVGTARKEPTYSDSSAVFRLG